MTEHKHTPVMPKATAVWLVENTSLTFKQIAEFCCMHELEIKGIADGDVAQGIIGVSPVTNHQLTREEIELCEKNPDRKLEITHNHLHNLIKKKKNNKIYTNGKKAR